MIIRVEANHKYVDEIQSVAQVFFPHARFGGDTEPGLAVDSYIMDGAVYAGLKGETIRESLSLTGWPVYMNEKRLAMLAMYRLLQRVVGAYTPWGALTGVRPTKMVREWLVSGQADNKVIQDLQSIFAVHEDRAKLAVLVANAENRLAEIITKTRTDPHALYISIPFCPTRCVYCSFNTSQAAWGTAAQTRYIQAVISEYRVLAKSLQKSGNSISSVYIGGGTPTALADHLLESLLSAIQEFTSHTEYTIEAGRPDTITRSNLRLMRKYGVNRISINPQTVNDRTLCAIGRNHTTQDFLRAYAMAQDEGFETINTDIIAGLPGESPDDMHRTMDTLAELKPENITVHTLAVKRASKLNEQRTEKVGEAKTNHANAKEHKNHLPVSPIPEAVTIEAQLKIAHDGCTVMGLSPYYLYRQKNMAALFENTGYSLPGHECLYNVGMMSEVQTVHGVGAGAVSKYVEGSRITRKFNTKNPDIYIERIFINAEIN